MEKFDVFIIGSGTAGETAVSELLGKGLSVGIADEKPYGGTCALRGCQPKKFLVVPAHAAIEGSALQERGFTAAPELEWTIMQRSLHNFTDPIPGATKKGLEEKGVICFDGHCQFVSPYEILCGDQRVQADHFIIAAGARPRPLKIEGRELALTSVDFLTLPELPEHITFIGGGYISMEFAYVTAAMGTEVTVLQKGSRVMERFDADMVSILMDACATRGIHIRTGVTPQRIEKRQASGYRIHLQNNETIDTELVIAAVGRIPNLETLGLDAAGVSYSPKGIVVDEYTRTSREHIFAIGDCVEGIQLSPVSDMEGRTAARNILEPGSDTSETAILPSVVFTYPQLAALGLQEAEVPPERSVRVIKGSGAGWPNYIRLNETHVGYKVIIDEENDSIVGAHLVGPYAGELINLFALAIKEHIPLNQLREFPWAYPTYTADIKYMLGV